MKNTVNRCTGCFRSESLIARFATTATGLLVIAMIGCQEAANRSGQEPLTLKGHTGGVLSVAFSPDGKRLASASWDGTVKVWDATSGQETLTCKAHTGPVDSVAFSADGKRLASASGTNSAAPDSLGEVKVWDATSGQETLTLNWHNDTVRRVAFSPDGKRLAFASRTQVPFNPLGEVKVWDLAPR